MDAALVGDEITLRLPAEAPFARVARVCAGALAARLGFVYEQVEDLRLAVDAGWRSLVDEGDSSGRSVEVELVVLADGLTVDLRLEGGGSVRIDRRR